MDQNFEQVVKEEIDKAIKGVGKINILIVGKSGVGKSTLINAIFRGDFAETGSGRPVTQHLREYTREDHPLTLIDTRGLEVADYEAIRQELENHVESRQSSDTPDEHIHIAWICIDDGSERVESAEEKLCDFLAKHSIPVVVVLTKARKNSPFIKEVEELMPKAKAIIAVRAIPKWIEELEAELSTMGLDDLIDLTYRLVPEAYQRAFAAALSNKNKKALVLKKSQAEKIVLGAVASAGTIALSPIPFSDAFLLVPVQVGMLAGIGMTYGMEVKATTLTTLVTAILGAGGAALAGRAIVAGLLKATGVGEAAGMAISAATATALTRTLGYTYISVLHDICDKNPDSELEINIIGKELKARFNMKRN